MKQFSTSLLISVLGGLFQFLGQLLLARELNESGYSEIALVFSLVANYLLITDLGTQVFFARHIANKSFIEGTELKGFLATRAVLGLLVLAFGTTHLSFMGLNGMHLISGSLLLLSATAISLVQVFEIIGYRLSQPVWSQASRLLRGGTWIVFCFLQFLVIKYFPDYFNVISLMNIFSGLIFLISTAMITYFLSKNSPFREFLFGPQLTQKLPLLQKTILILKAAQQFALKVLKTPQYTIGFALSWGTHVLISLTMTEIWTKNGLTQFFLAQNLVNPIALSIQIVSSAILSDSDFKVTKQSRILIAGILFSVIFATLLLYFVPEIFQWAIPSLSSITAVELLIQAIGIAIPAVGTLYFIKEFHAGKKHWMILGPSIGFCCAMALLAVFKIGQIQLGFDLIPKSLIWTTIQSAPAFGYFIWKRIRT